MSANGHNETAIHQWRVGDRREITHRFTQEDLEKFADLTGDRNPIHMDGGFASRSAVGGQVVHGMLAASFVSALIGMEIPGPGALWNTFQINWREAIRLGNTLRFSAVVSAINSALNMLVLKIVGYDVNDTDKVFLDGIAKVMLISHGAVQQPPGAPTRDGHEIIVSTTRQQSIAESSDEDAASDDAVPASHSLSGKVVLVTGATGVLGEAVCRRLVRDGARLLLWGRDRDKLAAMVERFGESVAGTACCDLSDVASVTENAGILSQIHTVSGIVHAAAAPLNNLNVVDARNTEEFRNHWAIEVLSLQALVAAFMSAESKTPGRFIIAVLTQAIFDAPPVKMSAYASAKMACWSLIRSLALELGPRGIRSNAVSPGLMETPYSGNISVVAKKIEEASNPLRRLCGPQDVAEVIAFLYNPLAGFVNGVNLPVTGGLRMP